MLRKRAKAAKQNPAAASLGKLRAAILRYVLECYFYISTLYVFFDSAVNDRV